MESPNSIDGLAPLSPLSAEDFLTGAELGADEVRSLFATAERLKAEPARFAHVLQGRSAVLIFEKPSLRTRVSFEVGIARLGGYPLFYDHASARIGERESVHDYARNLERWVDVIIPRTYSHAVLEQLASFSRVPVVNALSDDFHPCQALADLFTLTEHLGELRGRRLAYVGDGNNVCRSLLLVATALGMHVTVISPEGFGLDRRTLDMGGARAKASGGSLRLTSDPAHVEGSDAVYTDAWTSMGREHEAQERRQRFLRYQVNPALMDRAGPGALFMHCLPAHRGEEVTDEVIDSPVSVVFDQAENRMHAQNALLVHFLCAKPRGPRIDVIRGEPARAGA